jgi:hypothetical protein
MKRCVLLATLCIALMAAHMERAQGQNPTLRVHGFGRFSCGVWLEARAKGSNPVDARVIQAHEWMSGFITAYNLFLHPRGDVATSTDADTVHAWLDDYCREKPTLMFEEAVIKLIEHLRTRLRANPS